MGIARKVLYTYADASVICGARELNPSDPAGESIINPRLIVEVLSDSTEAYDRGSKFQLYQQIDSLGQYVLVSQTAARVETFLRKSEAAWLMMPFSDLERTARLTSIDVELPLAEAYAGVEFPPTVDAQTPVPSLV